MGCRETACGFDPNTAARTPFPPLSKVEIVEMLSSVRAGDQSKEISLSVDSRCPLRLQQHLHSHGYLKAGASAALLQFTNRLRRKRSPDRVVYHGEQSTREGSGLHLRGGFHKGCRQNRLLKFLLTASYCFYDPKQKRGDSRHLESRTFEHALFGAL